MDLDARPAHASGLVTVTIDAEAIVVDERVAQLHHLDPVATAVWGRLDGETPLRDICRALADTFGAELAQVQADVTSLVERLVSDGLVDARWPVGPR